MYCFHRSVKKELTLSNPTNRFEQVPNLDYHFETTHLNRQNMHSFVAFYGNLFCRWCKVQLQKGPMQEPITY